MPVAIDNRNQLGETQIGFFQLLECVRHQVGALDEKKARPFDGNAGPTFRSQALQSLRMPPDTLAENNPAPDPVKLPWNGSKPIDEAPGGVHHNHLSLPRGPQ